MAQKAKIKTARTQYGKTVRVLEIKGNNVKTSDGNYHKTKLFWKHKNLGYWLGLE